MRAINAVKEATIGNPSTGDKEANDKNLKDMTALITGGTGGIGLEVAKALASAGAHVLLLSRKPENGEKAIAEIKNSIEKPVDVEFIPCDLGNMQQVKEVADKIRKEERRLDVLIAGAGVGVNKFDETSDGIDRHIGVNHIGHFLLINRLLPALVRTSNFPPLNATQARPTRIISISSELHRMAPSSTEFTDKTEVASVDGSKDTNESKELYAHQLYARSKLANLLFTRQLVRNVIEPNGYNIMALATHPGAVHTGQQDQFKEAYGNTFGTIFKALVINFMRTPSQGSASTVWAAVTEEVDGSDGKGDTDEAKRKWQGAYVTDPGVKSDPTSQAQDDKLAENLWSMSEELVKEKIGSEGLLSWDEKDWGKDV